MMMHQSKVSKRPKDASTVELLIKTMGKYLEYVADLTKANKRLTKFQQENIARQIKIIERANYVILTEFTIEIAPSETSL